MPVKKVRAKKHLGQHFLKDESVCRRMTELIETGKEYPILEVGPGMGVLTKYIIPLSRTIKVIEIDQESVAYLEHNFPELEVVHGDFLTMDLKEMFSKEFLLIGNFPYNISSQIVFKMLENKKWIPEMIGMFQKEVAERICASPGSKTYGILSVLTQAFYETKYSFTVEESAFDPPPKVKSGVIHLKRLEVMPECNEEILRNVVKTTFNNRRKTLRNTLKRIAPDLSQFPDKLLNLRPEQLEVNQFIEIACQMGRK